MTRLTTCVAESDALDVDVIVESPLTLPEIGRVGLDIRSLSEGAEIVIGQVSHRIASGKGPEEVVFFANTLEILEPYRNYLS